MYRRGGRGSKGVTAGLLVLIIMGMTDKTHGQFVRSCETPSPMRPADLPPVTVRTEAGVVARGARSLEMVPSLCVSERYDTNVFFIPPTPGVQTADFVTNVTPRLRLNHSGEFASGFLDLAGFGEMYARNPDLNFLGTSDSLSLNLDNSIKRLLPNAKLQILDAFRYTPLPPGFSGLVAGTSPGDPANFQNSFAQGFLIQRTNNITNTGSVAMSYATTATTSVEVSYTNGILRWGSSPIPETGGLLFDTTTQSGKVAGLARVSELDKANVSYVYTRSAFKDASGSSSATPIPVYNSNTATVGWARVLTPSLTAEFSGGAIVIYPGPTTTWAASGSLTMNLPNNRATISYSRQAYPSVSVSPVILIGDIVSMSAVQTITQQWQVAELVNYMRAAGGSGPSRLSYDSFSGSLDIYYWVSQVWSTAVSYEYMKYDTQLGSTKTNLDRQVFTISVRAMFD